MWIIWEMQVALVLHQIEVLRKIFELIEINGIQNIFWSPPHIRINSRHGNFKYLVLSITYYSNSVTMVMTNVLWLQSQRTLKASHEAVMAKVDELMGQLKDERLRSLGLESQLQANSFSQRRTEEVTFRYIWAWFPRPRLSQIFQWRFSIEHAL